VFLYVKLHKLPTQNQLADSYILHLTLDVRFVIEIFVLNYLYSGDSDAVLPLSGTRHSINAMKLKSSKRWYPWYHSHGLVGGWSQVYEDGLLTYTTVRAAGHEVPLSQPRLALFLFTHFLANHSLPSSPS
jgi:serine carboxypeptidase-like clade 2